MRAKTSPVGGNICRLRQMLPGRAVPAIGENLLFHWIFPLARRLLKLWASGYVPRGLRPLLGFSS